MIPIAFAESNKTLRKPDSMNDEECAPLAVFTDGQQCISCWRPGWRELIEILITRRIWISVLGGVTQPPIWLSGTKPFESKK